MKRKLMITALAILMIATSHYSQESMGFMNGQKFLTMAPDIQDAYSVGFMDGLVMGLQHGTNYNYPVEVRFPCIKGWTAGQMAAVLKKYLKAHPEFWHLPMNAIGVRALQQDCK